MSGFGSILLEQIQALVEKDQLVLPTLPEVALQAKQVAEDPMVTPAKLAHIIEQDPAISVRLFKVANSPLLRALTPSVDLKSAISRLGLTFTSNLIIGLAMEQMFQASSDLIDKKMRATWQHSADIAGRSMVLAKRVGLAQDQAMLAGLVSAIGVLPILTFIEENVPTFADELLLNQVIVKVSAKIGRIILQDWDFSPELVAVPEQAFDVHRNHQQAPDLVDIVLLSNLIVESELFADAFQHVEWHKVSAFERLGFEVIPGQNYFEALEDLEEDFASAEAMLAAS